MIALFLSTREIGWAMVQEICHTNDIGHLGDAVMHRLLLDALVLQTEGNILAYGESHELGVGVLHHCPDDLTNFINGTLLR